VKKIKILGSPKFHLSGINTARVCACGDHMAIVVLMACVASCVRVYGVCMHVGRVCEPSVMRLGVDDIVFVQTSCRSRWSSHWCTFGPACSVLSHLCCGDVCVQACVGVHCGGTSGVRLEHRVAAFCAEEVTTLLGG
jgi:hypothetical protein